MPVSAYALVVTFAVLSAVAGLLAARIVGPWTVWSPILPALGAFGALYLVGHRWVISVGPEVTLWGWKVSLPFDAVVALAAAVAVSWTQRGVSSLLQA
jgi:hypothetical protein